MKSKNIYHDSVKGRSSAFSIPETQVANLRNFGFTAVDEITSVTEVASIRSTIAELFEDKTASHERVFINLLGSKDDNGVSFAPQLLSAHHYRKDLLKTEFFGNALAAARQLLGERAEFMSDHVILKPPNGPATPWHQDEAFRHPAFEHDEISIWLPLQPVNESSGCMAFIPKSHFDDVLPHRRVNLDAHALECVGVDADRAVSCPIPVGACTIHKSRTIHGSGRNLSNEARYAYILIFRLPPVPSRRLREFPWLDGTQTPSMPRARFWRRNQRHLFVLWRKFHDKGPSEYGAILARQFRKWRYLISINLRRNNMNDRR